MDISLKWLSKYVDISEYSPKELADKITVCGVEVEDIKYLAQGSNLIIGEVLECSSHPDSDHLHVTKVNIGSDILQIVCGAPNVAKGQKVIVALPNAYLPAKDITIQKGVIRGIESNGMICSLVELGVDKKYLTEEQCNGIEVLSNDAKVGDTNPLGYLGLDDVIFELKPTPNRGDVLSVESFSYELAACINKKVKNVREDIKFDNLVPSSFEVDSKTPSCHLFSIKGVRDVKIKESPKWLKEYLNGCSIRSINNIVDIGNYVMLLTGQPLHMYDADKISSHKFVVRDDFDCDYVALDDTTYHIEKGDIVITHNDNISCIGGIMGGKNSEVSNDTKNVAIEAAIFDSIQVRKTSIRLDLISDSSTRFVRGIDESRNAYALDLAAKLLVELADAKIVEETVTFGNPIVNSKPISLTLNRVNGLLGTNFTMKDVKDVFDRLAFENKLEKDTLIVTPPSYRKDIFDTEDLVEEVIRLKGFDNLVSTYPITSNVGSLTHLQKGRKLIRYFLLSQGIDEAYSYSLIHNDMKDDFLSMSFQKEDDVVLLHPLTEDHKYFRKGLLSSLLKAYNYNYYHENNDVKLFEISNVYTMNSEHELLSILLGGKKLNLEWNEKENQDYNFYHIKGLVTSILEKLGINENRYSLVRIEEDNKDFHIGASCYIKTGNTIWGVIGMVHPNMLKKYDVLNCAVCEIDLRYLLDIKSSMNKFVPLSNLPSTSRDIALVIDENIDSDKIIRTIKKNSNGLVSKAYVFDEYKGEHVGSGKKSLAIHIVYHSDKETLKDSMVNPIHENILLALNKEFGAKLRS